MSLTAIILAAGKSTRMKSGRPKPLHEICGRPMLQYVLDACFGAGCDRALVVVGYGKDAVIDRFGADSRIDFVEQGQQLGTGHAAKVCQAALKGRKGEVFILAGDGPLIRSEILQDLLATHRRERASASMATARLDDPTGYGRVIRDSGGKFVAIIEQLDATPEQRAIKEVFPSYYCVNVDSLNFALDRLKNENKKGEYYLTDIFGILRAAGQPIAIVPSVLPEDVLAVNDREQQAQVDAIMQKRIQRALRAEGVSIVAEQSTYIEAGAAIGPDTIVQPFTFVGRDARIGPGCTLGPFVAVPREAIVPEGSVITSGHAAMETGYASEQGNRS
ncbi:MAG TPA: NTP transferase domain-containing protein [Tepidisphaeraceae bacterium]|jgi:bifunctional UDP-N-acetylglucosamine pyrophosphorylase/glucosamine-1-phosphate N-acetyltransferase|nr:NTP transferase domain-containing protein [Tepidisphaeraceae bacterium]